MTRDEINEKLPKLVERLTTIDKRNTSDCPHCREEFKQNELTEVATEIARLKKLL